jgi:hypothetical protein
VEGFCEYGDEPSSSGTTDLVSNLLNILSLQEGEAYEITIFCLSVYSDTFLKDEKLLIKPFL